MIQIYIYISYPKGRVLKNLVIRTEETHGQVSAPSGKQASTLSGHSGTHVQSNRDCLGLLAEVASYYQLARY